MVKGQIVDIRIKEQLHTKC